MSNPRPCQIRRVCRAAACAHQDSHVTRHRGPPMALKPQCPATDGVVPGQGEAPHRMCRVDGHEDVRVHEEKALSWKDVLGQVRVSVATTGRAHRCGRSLRTWSFHDFSKGSLPAAPAKLKTWSTMLVRLARPKPPSSPIWESAARDDAATSEPWSREPRELRGRAQGDVEQAAASERPKGHPLRARRTGYDLASLSAYLLHRSFCCLSPARSLNEPLCGPVNRHGRSRLALAPDGQGGGRGDLAEAARCALRLYSL